VIARGCGEATDVAGVLAGSLRAALAAVPGADISSAVVAAATMSSRAAADAVRAVRKLASSSQELVACGTWARPAGRA
jgi:hypothetical protein